MMPRTQYPLSLQAEAGQQAAAALNYIEFWMAPDASSFDSAVA
jgi:hypothetical protein